MGNELWQESATTLAELIRTGASTSREIVEAHLERIEAVNPLVNAVVEVRPDEVRREADAADAAVKAGGALGLLHGVPFTIKINLDVAGYATSEGTVALKDFMATEDAPTVERMRAAGAVALARTNMPDLGLRMNTVSELYGATHNPWRHGLTAGGSSGGEGAAIASGMSPIGLGNDIGGSLRNPAYACGIASIKPSRGRVAHRNPSSIIDQAINAQIMLAEGVLARQVGDVRRGLEVVMGAHRLDPQSIDAPLMGRAVSRRVALVPEPMGGTTDPNVAEGVRIAGRALEAAGYHVEEIEPPMLFESYIAWAELQVTSMNMNAPLLDLLLGEDAKSFIQLGGAGFGSPSAESMFRMHQSRWRVASEWRKFMTEYPLVVGPTWTEPPYELGFDIQDADSALKAVEMIRFVLPANLLGLPAACVPTGVVNGLPTGAQIIGDLFREDLCLDAAQAVEESVGVLTPIDPRE
jgi:amidase